MTRSSDRIYILLSSKEATALDGFLTKNGLPSRAAAIHEVLKRALGVAPKNVARGAAPSVAFGDRVTKPMTKPWERAKLRTARY